MIHRTATQSRAEAQAAPEAAIVHLPHVLAAALLGLFIVFGVGFAPIEVVHNAAHDTRHSIFFPCH
ncbi:MAG: CbtB domain-containing protein [Alphaproteobacteria bacterium]